MSLLKRRFREELHPLLTWGITLFLTSLALMLFGRLIYDIQLTEGLDQILGKMPPMVRNMFGGGPIQGAPYLYIIGMAFDTLAPILLLVYTSLTVLGFYTREAGQGNLEFLFSLPIKRSKLIAQRILVFFSYLAMLQVLFALGVILGAQMTGLKIDYNALTWAVVDLYLLFVCIGGLAFLLSLTTNDYSRGMLLVLGILLGLFVLNIGVGDVKSVLAYLNPFHYYDAAAILRELTVPWLEMCGFALTGLVFWGAGIGLYIRKQISS